MKARRPPSRAGTLSVEQDANLCRIALARPPVNALDRPLLDQLARAIRQAGAQPGQAIILTGAPGHFCAGLDAKILEAAPDEERRQLWAALRELLDAAAASPAPIAAALTGHCLGAGAILAALCDYRVMETGDYKIGLPEVKLGLPLPGRVQRVIARLVGEHRAQRLCVEGWLLDPEQARRFGLVDDLVAPEEAAGAAAAWCEQILSLPQAAVAAMRAEFRRPLQVVGADA